MPYPLSLIPEGVGGGLVPYPLYLIPEGVGGGGGCALSLIPDPGGCVGGGGVVPYPLSLIPEGVCVWGGGGGLCLIPYP